MGREEFETQFMDEMLNHTRNFGHFTNVQEDFIEPWVAIDCLRKVLSRNEAVIYQP